VRSPPSASNVLLSVPEHKGERRSGSHKRLLYCVNVNRTSLDHLLLGVVADIDEMSHGLSIAPGKKEEGPFFREAPRFRNRTGSLILTAAR
jgi:hypothetical protein